MNYELFKTERSTGSIDQPGNWILVRWSSKNIHQFLDEIIDDYLTEKKYVWMLTIQHPNERLVKSLIIGEFDNDKKQREIEKKKAKLADEFIQGLNELGKLKLLILMVS